MAESEPLVIPLVLRTDELAVALTQPGAVVAAIVFSKVELAALMADVEQRGMSLPSGVERRDLRSSYEKIVAARLALNRAPSPRPLTDRRPRQEGGT